ncbi:MAG: copper-binding protein [Deltaproteobacteria bacterium]|jgi:Cu(I)/Ag(I) efflux system protein CusF|nr:copper-binding protein [Deltaproteobacteria bacterium]
MNQRLIPTLVPALFLFLNGLNGTAMAADHNAHSSGHGASQAETATRAYTTTGIVENLDKTGGSIVIRHEPVPALSWPAMTMRFVAENPALLEETRPGGKIRFDFRAQGSTCILVDLEALD